MKNSFLFHLHRLKTIRCSVAQILNLKYLIDFFVRTTSYIYFEFNIRVLVFKAIVFHTF